MQQWRVLGRIAKLWKKFLGDKELLFCITDGIKEIVPELKRQGANLNQIAKRLNERGYIDYKKELPTVLDEVKMVWQKHVI